MRAAFCELSWIDGPVDYTADISQASAPLRMKLAAAATAAPLCGDDLFAYERMAIIRYDIRFDILSGEAKAIANEIGHSVASRCYGAQPLGLP